jgi:phage gp29-like protein
MHYNIVSSIVSKVLANSPDLPSDYRDADLATQRRVEREAEAQGTTPARIWQVLRAQHSADIKQAADAVNGTGFDPGAIAKSARR